MSPLVVVNDNVGAVMILPILSVIAPAAVTLKVMPALDASRSTPPVMLTFTLPEPLADKLAAEIFKA